MGCKLCGLLVKELWNCLNNMVVGEPKVPVAHKQLQLGQVVHRLSSQRHLPFSTLAQMITLYMQNIAHCGISQNIPSFGACFQKFV